LSGHGSGLIRKSGVVGRLTAAGLTGRKYDLNTLLLEQFYPCHSGFGIHHVHQAGAEIIDFLRLFRISAHIFLSIVFLQKNLD
jgi:hypothetical protein